MIKETNTAEKEGKGEVKQSGEKRRMKSNSMRRSSRGKEKGLKVENEEKTG